MEELCELANAGLRCVLWVHSSEFPHGRLDRCKFELGSEEVILLAEWFSRVVGVQNTTLAHEDSCELEEIIAMLTQVRQRCIDGQLLEGDAVSVKAEIVREGDVEGFFPTVGGDVEEAVDGVRFAGETSCEHGLFPADSEKAWVLEQEFGTSVGEIG